MAQYSTIRPGYLIGMSTRIIGGVTHFRETLESPHTGDEGEERSRWETLKVVRDPAEYAIAKKVRSKARSLVASPCSITDFGMLCPEDKIDLVYAAMEQARKLEREFNAEAKTMQVKLNMICGRVEQDDVKATRAIKDEAQQLLAAIKDGVQALDRDVILDNAARVRALSQMLGDESKDEVDAVVKEVRSVARQLKKAGEDAVFQVDQLVLQNLDDARALFLDEDHVFEVEAPEMEASVLDLEDEAAQAAS